MDLVEKIEDINSWLLREYGKLADQAVWRVTWSDDQIEKRKGEFNWFDDNGNFVRTEVGIHEVRKYPWIKSLFVLERLLPVPEMQLDELLTPLSYEPIFLFADKNDQFLPPRIEVCKLVIEAIYAQAAKVMGVKYKEPIGEEAAWEKKLRLDEIKEELFGNETDTGTSMKYKEAIVVPGQFTGGNNQ